MSDLNNGRWAGHISLAHRVITGWALFGGLVLIAVVLINAYSILAGAIINKPFPGDFELTEMGVAIAAFCFLPYCQQTGANVSADIFTMKAGATAIALMKVLAAIAAVGFSALLIWRMWFGLLDYIEYEEITGILSIPLWYAFLPAVFSLVLLLVAAILTFVDEVAAMRAPR